MPTYEYKCSNCGYMLEELQSMSAEPLRTCPKCHKETLKRGLGGGSGMIFKGQGFHVTDYKKGGGSSRGEGKTKSADDSKSATSKDSPKTDTPKKDSGDSSKQSSPPPDKKS